MFIANLNRFHWAILGAVLGAAIGYLWTTSGQSPEGMGDQAAFERDVVRKDEEGNPLVRRIVIHPSQLDFRGRQTTLVTYERLTTGGWATEHFYTAVPYTPIVRKISYGARNLTVAEYLRELIKQSDQWQFVTYSDGWWTEPRNAGLVGAGTGLLILGGIWPTILRVMVGAGLGPKEKPKGESLWWNRRQPPTPTAKKVVSEAEHQRVQEAVGAYELSLQSALVPTEAPTAVEIKLPSKPKVSDLETNPLQEAAKQSGNDDDIELKGEFYPVKIHHHKIDPGEHRSDNCNIDAPP